VAILRQVHLMAEVHLCQVHFPAADERVERVEAERVKRVEAERVEAESKFGKSI